MRNNPRVGEDGTSPTELVSVVFGPLHYAGDPFPRSAEARIHRDKLDGACGNASRFGLFFELGSQTKNSCVLAANRGVSQVSCEELRTLFMSRRAKPIRRRSLKAGVPPC